MSMLRFETVDRASLFTRLDFRSKLVMVFAVLMLGILWESPIANAILAVSLVAMCLLAGVKTSYIRSIFMLMIPFWLLMMVIHGFFSDVLVERLSGKETLTILFAIPENWWLIGGGELSMEGVLFGVNVMFKTLAMVLSIPLAIFTTDIDMIVVSMVRSGLPYKIAFVFSSTLRFFPMLFEEVQLIIEAQRLRGLALEKMNMFQRLSVYSRIGIPLILSAMTKSQQLEVVLQSKGFSGSSDRTYCYESTLSREDWTLMISMAVLFAAALTLYFTMGVGKFSWLIY